VKVQSNDDGGVKLESVEIKLLALKALGIMFGVQDR
jgi:hypothetical protein